MKENRLILSRIDITTNEIISIITQEKRMAFDEASILFKKSSTYQLLKNIETELYLEDVVELLEMWRQEQVMDEFLNAMIQPSNNRLVELSNQEVRNSLKIKAFLEERTIEELYYEFTHPNKKDSKLKSKVKEPTPYSN